MSRSYELGHGSIRELDDFEINGLNNHESWYELDPVSSSNPVELAVATPRTLSKR